MKLEKLGTDYGGWIIPTQFINAFSICYCFGAGEDISFDYELVNRFGCKVYIFDPTPKAKKCFQDSLKTMSINKNLFNYFDYGIWSKTEKKKFFEPKNPTHVSHSILNLQKTNKYFEAKCKRLSQIMKELDHKKLDILKLDIEGAEYEVIESIILDNLNIKLICVEFHLKVENIIKKLLNYNYKIIAEDGLNYTFLKKII